MTTIPTDLLARLRAVLTAAEAMTPGPWTVHLPSSLDRDDLAHIETPDRTCEWQWFAWDEPGAEENMRGLVALRNATADLAALLALVEAPAGVEPTCACGSRLVGGVPGDAARFGWVCYECRLAKVEFADGTPLTVGAALADPRVQDGSHVVEYVDGDCWEQERVCLDRGDRLRARYRDATDRDGGGVRWTSGWLPVGAMRMAAYALPCRLVPLADADRDPATRGPL